MRADAVVVFARAPERGRVKTRLAAELGDDLALALYTWLARRVVRGLCVEPRGWDVILAATPATEAVARWMPEADAVVAQHGDDLGARLAHALEGALARGHRRVVVVGTDCVAVDAACLTAAFDALAQVPAVLGPAEDGGYYLLGATCPLPVFDAMPWSTAAVARITRERLRHNGIAWHELAPARDVDTRADLVALAGCADLPPALRALMPAER